VGYNLVVSRFFRALPDKAQILNRKQPLAAAQKIRTGVVELRTSTGSVYAKPSFWERMYLLWMFRNFHCLPKEVLGLHQRRLIEKLCRAAVRQRSIAQTDIIGIVENVRLIAPKAEVAVTSSKLIKMAKASVEMGRPRAVAAGGTPVRWDPSADRGDITRLIAPSTKVEEIFPPKNHSVPQDGSGPGTAAETKIRTPMRSLAWILAGAFVVVGAGILFRLLTQPRPAPLASVSQAVAEAPPFRASAPLAAVVLPEPAQPTVAPGSKPSAAIPESKPLQPPISVQQPESNRISPAVARLPIATPVAANEDSAPEPRLQITQPPESGFRYPEAPSSSLTGKVSLRAVIGTDGTVTEVDVISGNRALAVAAVQAVRHWRYRVPEMNGHAVEAETNIAINFVGDDAVSVSFPAAR